MRSRFLQKRAVAARMSQRGCKTCHVSRLSAPVESRFTEIRREIRLGFYGLFYVRSPNISPVPSLDRSSEESRRAALLQQLTRALASRDSATCTLQRLSGAVVRVRILFQGLYLPLVREKEVSALPSDLAAEQLIRPSAAESLVLRHVSLACGDVTLSEAWNVYVPDRLSCEARARLADEKTPFGTAVKADNFWRERLSSRTTKLPPGTVLEQRALLRTRKNDAPLAYVVERYTEEALRLCARVFAESTHTPFTGGPFSGET